MAFKLAAVLALLLAITIGPVYPWFSCGEVEFCPRIRYADAQDNFNLDLSNLQVNDNSIEAELVNTNSQKRFSFVLTGLADDTYRVFIDDPDNNRHKVEDALDGEPQQVSISAEQTSSGITVSAGNSKAEVQSSPFRIQFYRGDDVVAIINNQGRFAFEEQEPEVAIGLDVYFPGAQKAYGLPAHSDHLALRNTGQNVNEPYRFYNIDHAGFDAFITQAIYGTIPVLYAHSAARSAGFFWLNSAQTFVDIDSQDSGLQTFWFSESGAIDFFVLTGPTLKEAVHQYVTLTGVAPLPQYHILAYHQSRYSYQSIDDVKSVVNGFDENNFPLDTMWLDVDYTNGKRYFTWHPDNFNDPIGLQEFLNSTGRKLVGIIDPHFYVDEGYFVWSEAEAAGYFVKNADGASYQAECWPGLSSWIDFFDPEARAYYASLFAFDRFEGSTEIMQIWNDMNEPAVFGGYEASMPKDNIHYGGWTHRDVHNQYGFYQTMGTYQGLYDRMNGNQRPFVMTRAHFAGSQRYSAIWTGDNKSEWPHLVVSIPMCLNEALGGMSQCGADIGGFLWNVNENLLIRWTQAGVWLPFFRQHSNSDVNRREPYLWDSWIQDNLRYAMYLRYKHLPYWYTLFYEHERTGEPVIKPIVYNYPTDENIFENDYEWLIGDNILARPVTEDNVGSVDVYFPGGNSELWYDVENTLMYRGNGFQSISVDISSNVYFYKGGSIVPRRDTERSASIYTHEDDITLYAFLDLNNQATGTLYIDDNTSFDYRNNKEYYYARFTLNDNSLSTEQIDSDNSFDGPVNLGNVVVYRPPSAAAAYKGATLTTKTRGNVDFEITYGPDGKYFKVENLKVDLREPFTLKFY